LVLEQSGCKFGLLCTPTNIILIAKN